MARNPYAAPWERNSPNTLGYQTPTTLRAQSRPVAPKNPRNVNVNRGGQDRNTRPNTLGYQTPTTLTSQGRTAGTSAGAGGAPLYGSSGGSAISTSATGAAAPMSQQEWLANDDAYTDTVAAQRLEYENLLAQLQAQQRNYETDLYNTLRNLGLRGHQVSGGSIQGGEWDTSDRLGAYGRQYQNLMNDFASRGMLQSTLFGGAQNDMQRGFNQQRADLAGALQQLVSGIEADRASAQAARDAAITAAQRESIARRAATYGLT